MGANYGSIQIRGENRDAVKMAVESVSKELKRKFLIGPSLKGSIAVYPDESGQDDTCAIALAQRLHGLLLQLIVHDDSVFIYNFFAGGELLNEYSSKPDYFEEIPDEERERLKPKPELFRDLVSSPDQLAKLTRLLSTQEDDEEFVFEQKRLEQFADLLGIQNALTCYDYLMDGERDGIREWTQFIHIPDQSAEKAAKKAAEAAIRQAKLELKKAGILCNEWTPYKRGFIFPNHLAADPINGGFLFLSYGNNYGDPTTIQQLLPPWPKKPEVINSTLPLNRPEDLLISPKGTWLALSEIGGVRLWGWPHRKFIDRQPIEGRPVAFTGDEKFLLCKRQKNFVMLSVESWQIVKEVDTNKEYPHFLGFHPSNSFLLTQPRDDQMGVTDLASGSTKVVLYAEEHEKPLDMFAEAEEACRTRLVESPETWWRSSSKIMRLNFSPDGKLLFCATTIGLRVYAWEELLTRLGETFKPVYSITPIPESLRLGLDHYDNFIYDLVFDHVQNRILFCGRQGVIRYLNLTDGKTGVLVDPPGKSPMWHLTLSHDRKFICCICSPPVEERSKKPHRLQVWNYEALCKTAGLDWSAKREA